MYTRARLQAWRDKGNMSYTIKELIDSHLEAYDMIEALNLRQHDPTQVDPVEVWAGFLNEGGG